MKYAVVTGASGFIGKALCKRLLDEGVYVFAVVRDKNKIKDLLMYEQIEMIELELKDYTKISSFISNKNIDYFFHLSWEGVYGKSLTLYNQQIQNVSYACDTLLTAKKINARKFIFAGTVNELEIMSYLTKDRFEPRPACIYGSCKLFAEMLLKILAFNYDIEINIALIGSTYGPGDRSKMVQNVVISELLKKNSPKLVSADMMYDWVYIDDIVEGFWRIAEKGISQKSYYIGHSKFKRFQDIIEKIRDMIDENIPLEFGTIQDKANIDYEIIDIDALYKDTGYVPISDFSSSMEKTIRWVERLNLDDKWS